MDLKQFKKEIIITTLSMAALAELISLIVIGPDAFFGGGLLAGTATTILSFLVLTRAGIMMNIIEKGTPVVLGYFVRMLLYGAVFFVCITRGLACGIGALAGFLSLHFGMMVLYGIVYRFIIKKENPLNDWTEPKQWNDLSVYDDEEDDWGYPQDRK